MTEDKARDRVESVHSGRERNAVMRSQEPAAARMDFFNELLRPGTNGAAGVMSPSFIVAFRVANP